MPGYGLLPHDQGRLLPWSWAEERLRSNKNYWLSTVSGDGSPHAMAVWAVWIDGALFFSTGGDSRKALNLRANPRCVLTTESAEEAVIVQGRATLAEPPLDDVGAAYQAKYGMGYPDDSNVYRVAPIKVFGFIENELQFTSTATRWRF